MFRYVYSSPRVLGQVTIVTKHYRQLSGKIIIFNAIPSLFSYIFNLYANEYFVCQIELLNIYIIRYVFRNKKNIQVTEISGKLWLRKVILLIILCRIF